MNRKNSFSAFVAQGKNPRPTILEALRFAQDFLAESCLEERLRVKGAVIVEELISNSLHYGGAKNDVSLCLTLTDNGKNVELVLEDNALQFDPTKATKFIGPDPISGGSVGLAIVRNWSDDLRYTRKEERNHLSLIIR